MAAMHTFRHLDPPLRLYCGEEALARIGSELDRAGCRRAVIVCGPSAGQSAALDRVRAALGERCVGVFPDVRLQSPLPTVLDAAREFTRLEADAAVAFGGGSAIVTARAAAIVAAEGEDIVALATSMVADRPHSPRLETPKVAQFVVPTTPTTAIVKAGSAVFDPAVGKRRALFDPATRARAVFVVPDLLPGVPMQVFVSASLDTLSMAVEGLISARGDPLADAELIHALRLAVASLSHPGLATDVEPRSDLVLAAILCGRGTDHAGGGIIGALGHALGARHEIPNGVVEAILVPHALRFNASVAEQGLRKVATAMDLAGTTGSGQLTAVISQLAGLFGRLGVPRRLRDVGIAHEALPAIAELAMEDWFLQDNPRPVRAWPDLLTILEQAW